VISEGSNIVPIEVKSGKTGRLKSLHQFIYAKKPFLAARFNTEPPSFTKNTDQMPNGNRVEYNLLSMPLYMAEELRRIIQGLR
jgi:hypothetical protein